MLTGSSFGMLPQQKLINRALVGAMLIDQIDTMLVLDHDERTMYLTCDLHLAQAPAGRHVPFRTSLRNHCRQFELAGAKREAQVRGRDVKRTAQSLSHRQLERLSDFGFVSYLDIGLARVDVDIHPGAGQLKRDQSDGVASSRHQ